MLAVQSLLLRVLVSSLLLRVLVSSLLLRVGEDDDELRPLFDFLFKISFIIWVRLDRPRPLPKASLSFVVKASLSVVEECEGGLS